MFQAYCVRVADMVHLLAEQSDTKSSVKWAGFDPCFERRTCLATLFRSITTLQSVCG